MTVNVQVAEASGVATISLDRPDRLNAVNAVLVEDLLATLERVEHLDAKAVVLAGRGRAFSAGHDLKEDLSQEGAESTAHRLRRLQEVTLRIQTLDVAVVAAVHGYAIGAGAELALCCDLVVAAEATTFQFPEVSLGLSVTNAATRLLPALVGPLRAKQLVMLGEAFDAEAAHRMGLVNLVVPPEDLLAAAQGWAAKLADRPRQPLALAKKALNHGLDGTVATALDLEVSHALATSGAGDSA